METALIVLASVILGAYLKSHYDRAGRFQDRLIDAADEFGRAMACALLGLSAAVDAERDAPRTNESAQAVARAWQLHSEAAARSARLDLLFKPDVANPKQDVPKAATRVLHTLKEALNTLAPPSSEQQGPDMAEAERLSLRAKKELDDFQAEAREEIRLAAPPVVCLDKWLLRRLARRDAVR